VLCFAPWALLKKRGRRGGGEREVTVGAEGPVVPWLVVAVVGLLLSAWLRSKWRR
jgi:hypothetical protein